MIINANFIFLNYVNTSYFELSNAIVSFGSVQMFSLILNFTGGPQNIGPAPSTPEKTQEAGLGVCVMQGDKQTMKKGRKQELGPNESILKRIFESHEM